MEKTKARPSAYFRTRPLHFARVDPLPLLPPCTSPPVFYAQAASRSDYSLLHVRTDDPGSRATPRAGFSLLLLTVSLLPPPLPHPSPRCRAFYFLGYVCANEPLSRGGSVSATEYRAPTSLPAARADPIVPFRDALSARNNRPPPARECHAGPWIYESLRSRNCRNIVYATRDERARLRYTRTVLLRGDNETSMRVAREIM